MWERPPGREASLKNRDEAVAPTRVGWFRPWERPPGREAAPKIAARLVRHTYTRVVDLPEGKQPDTVEPEEIAELVGDDL